MNDGKTKLVLLTRLQRTKPKGVHFGRFDRWPELGGHLFALLQ